MRKLRLAIALVALGAGSALGAEAPKNLVLADVGLHVLGIGYHETRLGVVAAVGVSIGYAFLIRRHLHIALGTGVQYHLARIAGGRGIPSFGDFYPVIDASIGYAF